MTTASMPLMYENREWVAQGSTIFLGIALALMLHGLVLQHEPLAIEEPIQITLAEPVVEDPKPENEPPKPIKQLMQPMPIQQKVVTEPVPQQLVSPVQATPSPLPQANSVIVPEAPASPSVKAMPKVEEIPVVQRDAAAEGRFAQDVRTQIERKKIYPSTARELGMSGAVEVVYVLDRMGKLLKADIALTSGFPMLDQAALRAVRSADFAALPADAWVGERQKEFRTKLVFSISY